MSKFMLFFIQPGKPHKFIFISLRSLSERRIGGPGKSRGFCRAGMQPDTSVRRGHHPESLPVICGGVGAAGI